MRAVLILAKANLMQRKASSVLILLIILLSALILSTAMGMLQMMSKPFENMFERQKASHVIMYYDENLNKGKDIVGFWRAQPDIASVNVLKAYMMSGNPYFKGEKLSSQFILTEMPAQGLTQDKIAIVEGKSATAPGEKEIWIPTVFATANNIKTGDYLELPTLSGAKNYRVGAIVVDPHYSNSMMNPLRVWVRSGEIEQSFHKENPVRYVGLRYKNYSPSVEAAAWNRFEKSIGGPFVGNKTTYETIKFSYTFTYKILSVILLAFAAIIVLIGFVIIFYTLSSSVLADYATIGVMKAQGFSSHNLSGVYLLQFFLLSLIAVPLGILISYPVQQLFLAGLVKSLGIDQIDKTNLLSGAVTFLVIMLMVLASAYSSSLKAARIKPTHALRYGAPERKYAQQHLSLKLLRSWPVNLMLGVRDIFSEKKQTAFILIISLFTGLVFAFAIASNSSMNKAFSNMELFGLDNSELSVVNSHRVQGVDDGDLLQTLQNQPEIQKVTPMLYLLNSSFYMQELKANKNIIGNAFDTDMNSIGLKVMEGRNPVDQNEIALSYGLATKMHIKPGDTVQVNLEGLDKSLFVSGIFQNMSNGGEGFRVQMKGVPKSALQMSTMYQVKLKDPAIAGEFAKTLAAKLGAKAEITNLTESTQKMAAPILAGLNSTITVLLATVILVCFITIFNTIAINILQMRKKYGIYKAFGMSSLDIRLTILLKVLIVAVMGTLLGIISGVLITSLMMSTVFGLLGIAKMATIIEPAKLLLILPACMLITALSAWLPSGRVLKIHPRNLVVE